MATKRSRTAVVTGGAQGIGKAIARRLLDDGYSVVIADLDAQAGRETAGELADFGRVLFVETDVASEADVSRLFDQTLQEFGGLQALVNNAGIADPHNGPIEDLALDTWNRILSVNLGGHFLCTKHAAAHLRARGGAVVNMASTRAMMSEPNTEAYAASKGAIVALTHALAISLAPDVRVNCICPGWIATEAWQSSDRRSTPALRPIDHAQHPSGRVGRPEDIAEWTAFLLSDAAAFVTGQPFVVDGGMTRKMMYEG